MYQGVSHWLHVLYSIHWLHKSIYIFLELLFQELCFQFHFMYCMYVFVRMICCWRLEHISGPHLIFPTQQHLLPVKFVQLIPASPPPFLDFGFKKKKKNWPPAGCSCFVGPGAMLQTHMTLWSEPPSLSRECHPRTLTSWVQVYSETRTAQVNYLHLTPCISLRGARWGEKSGLFFPKVFCRKCNNTENKAALTPHKEVLICAVHMHTAGSTKLSQ